MRERSATPRPRLQTEPGAPAVSFAVEQVKVLRFAIVDGKGYLENVPGHPPHAPIV